MIFGVIYNHAISKGSWTYNLLWTKILEREGGERREREVTINVKAFCGKYIGRRGDREIRE